LVILVVSLLAGKLLVEALVGQGWPLIVYVAILAAIGYGPSLAWGVFVRGRWGAGDMTSVGWRFAWSDLGWGPLTWLAAVASQVALAAVILAFHIPLSSNVDSARDLEADRAYLIATAVTAVIAAPIIEELIFRGLVLRGFLSRMRPVAAIALQGILFGVAHVDPVRGWGNVGLAFVLSGVGVTFGVSAYLTRRLGPTVIAHAIFNGVVLLIVVSGVLDGVDRDVGTPLPPGASPAASPAAVVAERVVVDQTDVTEPRRHEQHRRPVDTFERTQRGGVDELDVLGLGAVLAVDLG
jgi:membrane protease YdiL (CAAX protease family)